MRPWQEDRHLPAEQRPANTSASEFQPPELRIEVPFTSFRLGSLMTASPAGGEGEDDGSSGTVGCEGRDL